MLGTANAGPAPVEVVRGRSGTRFAATSFMKRAPSRFPGFPGEESSLQLWRDGPEMQGRAIAFRLRRSVEDGGPFALEQGELVHGMARRGSCRQRDARCGAIPARAIAPHSFAADSASPGEHLSPPRACPATGSLYLFDAVIWLAPREILHDFLVAEVGRAAAVLVMSRAERLKVR